ncbi:hypothetical protein [Maritalea sp.]|uniref:hypothetical protein n=1 Tax=Maritalea sp. TaxID=2003361 RepID=UPI003EF2BEC9
MKIYKLILSASLMLFGSSAFAASTAATLPWDTAIGILSTSITGPWAYGVAIVALATAFGTLAFNNDLSGAGKTLVFLTIAIAGLVLVTTLVTSLFGGAASTSSITTMQAIAIFILLSIASIAATLQRYMWSRMRSTAKDATRTSVRGSSVSV